MLSYFYRALGATLDVKVVVLSFFLILANLFFNVFANVAFKYSADGTTWRNFLFWQVVGNLAGLITVLTLTWLLKFMPLHVAFPVTTGLMVIGVSLVAARLVFHEEVTSSQWLGTFLVVAGIAFLSRQ